MDSDKRPDVIWEFEGGGWRMTSEGGFVANTTLGERVALMRDRRYKRRVWREVSRESEWEK